MSDNSLSLKKKNELPTLAELTSNLELAWKTDSLNHLLTQQPPANWVKTHPYIKDYRYLPIDKIEFLLRKIFKRYRIEVKKTGMILNAVEVSVRVHFLDPITGEWDFHDGVGAQELQTQSGSGNLKLDMSNINRGAVMMALPIAKSVAVKDACDHFGDLFGANLNRKDTLSFSPDKNLDLDFIKTELLSLFESKKELIPSSDYLEIEKIKEEVSKEINVKKIKVYKRIIDFLTSL